MKIKSKSIQAHVLIEGLLFFGAILVVILTLLGLFACWMKGTLTVKNFLGITAPLGMLLGIFCLCVGIAGIQVGIRFIKLRLIKRKRKKRDLKRKKVVL